MKKTFKVRFYAILMERSKKHSTDPANIKNGLDSEGDPAIAFNYVDIKKDN